MKASENLALAVQQFAQNDLNRYERLILENNQLSLKFRSLIVDSSIKTRLQCQENNRHRQVIWETSTSVIAPVLLGFVDWCLQKAERRSLQRLYFVARDGQIFLKIAKILCKNWGYNLDCRYLYGSRRAWHFPALQSIGESELEWMFESTPVSIRSVCQRVNITPEQIATSLSRHGFSQKMWERNLGWQEQTALKQVFQKEPDVVSLVVATAREFCGKAIGYLKQEGFDDRIPYGIVDIGWLGRLQRSLSNMLCSAEMYPQGGTYGFYFGLRKRVETLSTDYSFAYCYDAASPSKRYRLICQRPLLEIFAAADHGSTMRFEEVDGKYIPILNSSKNERALDWGLEVQQKAITEFVDKFSSAIDRHNCSSKFLMLTCESILNKFLETPTKEEAKAYGSYQQGLDMLEANIGELAPKLTFRYYCFIMFHYNNFPYHIWKPGFKSRNSKILVFILDKSISLKQKIRQITLKSKNLTKLSRLGQRAIAIWDQKQMRP